jgi:hypothetical protein
MEQIDWENRFGLIIVLGSSLSLVPVEVTGSPASCYIAQGLAAGGKRFSSPRTDISPAG